MTKINWLLKRAKTILQTEGFILLVRRGFPLLVTSFYQYRIYVLDEYALVDIQKLNEADVMPKIDSFTLKIVSTNQDVDKLGAEGLDFRSDVNNARHRLDKGAIAFCIFIDRELASICWVAMTQEAKDSLDEPPFRVDFTKGEVCGGNLWTKPRYRRMRLSEYIRFKRYQFLSETGRVIWRGAIPRGNIASRKGVAKFGHMVYAEGRYLRILWWKWWKEKPLI